MGAYYTLDLAAEGVRLPSYLYTHGLSCMGLLVLERHTGEAEGCQLYDSRPWFRDGNLAALAVNGLASHAMSARPSQVGNSATFELHFRDSLPWRMCRSDTLGSFGCAIKCKSIVLFLEPTM